VVSSLVGHSLEALRANPPTLMVCHDYYPFCPALNIFFETTCTVCTRHDLIRCTAENPHHRFFKNLPPSYWIELRRAFVRRVQENHVHMVAPTPSVKANYTRLLPELGPRFQVIPHGTPSCGVEPLTPSTNAGDPLRVVVLGSLAPHKGLALFEQIWQRLVEFAEVYLIGCGVYGERYAGDRITVLREYDWEQLPRILGEVRPDVGLLLSVVPETFSYSLQELFDFGIPPVATRRGSFQDRIQDGVNGFLCDPEPEEILRRLRALAGDRETLKRVHAALVKQDRRTVGQMVADYEKLVGSAGPSAIAYFCGDMRPLETKVTRVGTAQLYWRKDGEAFDEVRSVSVSYAFSSKSQRIRLPVPASEKQLAEVRLDFSNQPGFFLLSSLRAYDEAFQSAWSWDGTVRTFAEWPSHQVAVVGPVGEAGILLALTGDDPQVIIPLGEAGLARLTGGGVLEMEFSWPGWYECISVLVDVFLRRNGLEVPPAHIAALAQQIDKGSSVADGLALFQLGDRIGYLTRELTQALARIAELEHSWSWRLSRPLRLLGGAALKVFGR